MPDQRNVVKDSTFYNFSQSGDGSEFQKRRLALTHEDLCIAFEDGNRMPCASHSKMALPACNSAFSQESHGNDRGDETASAVLGPSHTGLRLALVAAVISVGLDR